MAENAAIRADGGRGIINPIAVAFRPAKAKAAVRIRSHSSQPRHPLAFDGLGQRRMKIRAIIAWQEQLGQKQQFCPRFRNGLQLRTNRQENSFDLAICRL